MQNALGIVWVVDLRTYTQYVAALFDVVLDIFILTLVRKLGQLDLLTGELLIEVVQVQGWGWKLLQRWWEHGSLESWHWRLELWRNESQWLVLHANLLVEIEALRNQVCIELE